MGFFHFSAKKNGGKASPLEKPRAAPPASPLKLSLLSLEQRLMFDAAAAATAAEVASEHVAQEQADAAVSIEPVHDSGGTATADSQDVLAALTVFMPAESRTEVIFVDPTVPDYQALLSGMDPSIEVILLNSGQDGVQQMASALSGRTGVDAIHLISHGHSGELQLGTGTLTVESMTGRYAGELAVIQQALSEQADILVYGCDFAEGDTGRAAVDVLTEMTGADIQASNDLTGHISLGGDWEFEVRTGTIETSLAVNYDAQMNWARILGTETVQDTFSAESYSNNDGPQSWSTSWAEKDAGGGGASGGDLRVNSSQLRIDTDSIGSSISRGVDLSRATRATLTFDYTNSLSHADCVELRVSTDGGTNYKTVSSGVFSSTANTGSGTARFDLSDFLSANTKIQFIVTGTGGGDRLYVDNVQVSYDTGSANHAPTVTSNGGGATASINIAENTAAVTTVTGTDADAGQALTYSIAGGADAARFTINSNTGQLSFVSAPNYEAPTDSGGNNVYDVTVQASDGHGGTDTQAIAVRVTDGNDAPTDLVQSRGTGIDLNTDGGNNSYLYTTNGGAILGGRTAFTIEVQFNSRIAPVTGEHKVLLSYATSGSDNEVRVGVAQTSSTTCQLTLTVHGSRINLSGYDARALFDGGQHQLGVSWSNTKGQYTFVVDGQQVGTGTGLQTGYTTRTTGTLVVGMDQDSVGGGFQTHQVFKGTLQDVRVFNDVRTLSEMAAYLNQDVPSNEQGLVADWTMNSLSGGRTLDAAVDQSLTVGSVSGSGWIASTPTLIWQVPENCANGTVVGSVSGTDPDASDTKRYSLTDTAGGRFAINSSTGVITVADGSLLNYEGAASHTVTVRVTDSGGLTYNESFIVKIANVNDAPTIMSNGGGSSASVTVDEGTVAVTTVTATDQDAGATRAYSISGGVDAAQFTINRSTGQLSFISAPNFEGPTDSGGNNVYDVTVQVSDGRGGTDIQTIAVMVANVNEGPADLSLSSGTVAENAANGTVVGTASSTDPDVGDTHTYSLMNSAGGRFSINARTGVITVADGTRLDYEAATSHLITVRTTDAGGLTRDRAFTIAVTNATEVSASLVPTTSVRGTVGVALASSSSGNAVSASGAEFRPSDDLRRSAAGATAPPVAVASSLAKEAREPVVQVAPAHSSGSSSEEEPRDPTVTSQNAMLKDMSLESLQIRKGAPIPLDGDQSEKGTENAGGFAEDGFSVAIGLAGLVSQGGLTSKEKLSALTSTSGSRSPARRGKDGDGEKPASQSPETDPPLSAHS